MRRMPPELAHPDGRQRVVHPFPYLRRRNAEILRPERHVFLDDRRDKLIIRVLEHHPDPSPVLEQLVLGEIRRRYIKPVNHYPPALRRDNQIKQLRQRRLPRPVMTEHRDERTALYLKRQIMQNLILPAVVGRVRVAHILYFNERIFHCFSRFHLSFSYSW